MLEAILAVDTPNDWKKEAIQKYHAKISVLDCLPHAKKGNKDLVKIEVDPKHMQMLLEDVKKNPMVDDVDLTAIEAGIIKGSVSTIDCIACCSMVGDEAFLMDSRLDDAGKTIWTLLVTEKESVRGLIRALEGHRYHVELQKLTSIDNQELMTSRQEDILRIAYERGYFDYPKRISLRDLASMFGISISTLSEMLRKGQRKIMEEYFGKGEAL